MTITHLSPDGELPANLDWDAAYDVTELPPSNDNIHILDLDWDYALTYAGPDISEMLTQPGSVYHQRIDDYLEVGFTFAFEVDSQDRIVAHGTLHPASIGKDNNYTFFDTTIGKADVVVNFKIQRTAAAVREYILAQTT